MSLFMLYYFNKIKVLRLKTIKKNKITLSLLKLCSSVKFISAAGTYYNKWIAEEGFFGSLSYQDKWYLGDQSKLKMSQIVEKFQKGGGDQRQNQNSLHFKWRLTLTSGGSEFFTFLPNSNNRNMTLIFMINGTDIGLVHMKQNAIGRPLPRFLTKNWIN